MNRVIVEEDIPKIVSEIMSAIRGSLPLDMEFPIFKFKGAPYEIYNLWTKFESNLLAECKPCRRLEDDNQITVILRSPGQFWNNIDNSKLRCWKKSGEIVMEMITNYIVAQSDLLERNNVTFIRPSYERIWRMIQNKIEMSQYIHDMEDFERDRIISKSLVVLYNYLFAVSDFIECMETIPVPSLLLDRVRLSYQDLALILGESFAYELYPELELLLEKKRRNPVPPQERISIRDFFAPQSESENYGHMRIRTLLMNSKISDIIEKIFLLQKKDAPDKGLLTLLFKRFYGETFIALFRLLKMRRRFEDMTELEVHEVVDTLIDSGKIIPKYELQRSNDGKLCWRRYFHAGII